ncbi:hypothetical protein V8E51_019164 [Hyaloscypha variabilis]
MKLLFAALVWLTALVSASPALYIRRSFSFPSSHTPSPLATIQPITYTLNPITGLTSIVAVQEKHPSPTGIV